MKWITKRQLRKLGYSDEDIIDIFIRVGYNKQFLGNYKNEGVKMKLPKNSKERSK